MLSVSISIDFHISVFFADLHCYYQEVQAGAANKLQIPLVMLAKQIAHQNQHHQHHHRIAECNVVGYNGSLALEGGPGR